MGGARKGRQDQGAPDRSEALLQPLEIIVADLFEIAPAELLGLAALSLSLGVTYWLVRDTDEVRRRRKDGR